MPRNCRWKSLEIGLLASLGFLWPGVLIGEDKSLSKPATGPIEIARGEKRDVGLGAVAIQETSVLRREQELGRAHLQKAYGRIPLYFEANQGQTAAEVSFLARGLGYGLFLTSTEAVLAVRQSSREKPSRPGETPSVEKGRAPSSACSSWARWMMRNR